jgi:WD40 repeat protein
MSFPYKYEKIIADEHDNICSNAFLNDTTLIVAMCKGKLRKIDIETSEILVEVDCPKYIDNIDIFDGVIVTSGSPCCSWDARTLTKITTYCEDARSVKILPQTRHLITGGHRLLVSMWDLDTGEFIKAIETEDTAYVVKCIEYDSAHDEVWYGAGSEIRCVNVMLRERMRTISQHTGVVYFVLKIGDDEFLSGCEGGVICKWKSDGTVIAQTLVKHSLHTACRLNDDVLISTYAYDLLLCNTITLECKTVTKEAYFIGPLVRASPSGMRFSYGQKQYEMVICRK